VNKIAEIYRAGYVGGAVQETLDWIEEKSTDAKRIIVPFTGIGRHIVAVQRADTEIYSWDTMAYSRYIVDGVFNAEKAESNVTEIRYRKGWMYEHRTYKNIDDRCAGFIDWVAQEGTLFDKAALGSAMTRSTLMGRLTHWKSNVEQLYTRFEKQREYNQDWLNQPGTRLHVEGDFFADLEALQGGEPCDLAIIDPPKVVNYSDVYSLHFNHFNQCLTNGQASRLPKWNRRNAMTYMRDAVTKIPASTMLFFYVNKVIPTYEDVKRVLGQYVEIEEEQEFYHNGRSDFALLLHKDLP